MRFQSTRSSCGPAALHNALAALGIERSEEELITLCKQTANGTSVRGLVAAMKSIPGTAPFPMRFKDSQSASISLWWQIAQQGRPMILCVDDFEHWVACVGHLGKRFAVVDSADNALVKYYTVPDLCERWEKDGQFYGVLV